MLRGIFDISTAGLPLKRRKTGRYFVEEVDVKELRGCRPFMRGAERIARLSSLFTIYSIMPTIILGLDFLCQDANRFYSI